MKKTLQQHSITESTLTSNSSLESKVFLAFKYRTPNRYKLLDKLTRANITPEEELTDKTIYLSEKSKKLLRAILKKFFRGETVLLNNKYITEVTRCKAGQNKNILAELANILDIKYYRLYRKNGIIFSYHYHFQLHPRILNELGLTGHKDIKSMAQFFVSSYINNKHAFNKSNRSSKSNFLQNSNSSIQTKSVEFIKEQKERSVAEVIIDNTHTEQTPLKLRNVKKRKKNQRKKPTNSSMKGKIIKLVSYSKPKSLGEMHQLLDQGMYDELRSKSGREFSNNFIAQKVLAMSKNPAITASFRYKAGFISYMSLALRHELHDAVKTSGESFRLRVNRTEEDWQDSEVEKFLTGIEQEAIRHVCSENQLKAKLANALEKTKAYQLLSKLKEFKVCGDTAQIHLNRVLSLTEHEKALILAQVQATYETVDFNGNYQAIEHLEFVVEKSAHDLCLAKSSNSNIQGQNLGSNRSEPLKLPKGVWGDVLQKLISEYGVDTYKHWFSKLTATVDEFTKTIELKASSSMIQEWIDNNYGESLARIIANMGMRFNGINLEW